MGGSAQNQFEGIMAAARARTLGLDDVKLQHGRSPEYERLLQEQRERAEAKLAATRRTRLHSFGLAGGRRS